MAVLAYPPATALLTLARNPIFTIVPIGSGPSAVHVIVLSAVLTTSAPREALAELATRVVPDGMVSFAVALLAAAVPLLSRLRVYVTVPAALTWPGLAV